MAPDLTLSPAIHVYTCRHTDGKRDRRLSSVLVSMENLLEDFLFLVLRRQRLLRRNLHLLLVWRCLYTRSSSPRHPAVETWMEEARSRTVRWPLSSSPSYLSCSELQEGTPSRCHEVRRRRRTRTREEDRQTDSVVRYRAYVFLCSGSVSLRLGSTKEFPSRR